MQDAHDFDLTLFVSIDDEILSDLPKTKRFQGEIATEVPYAGGSGEFIECGEKFVANAIGKIYIPDLVRIIVPDFVQVGASDRREDEISHPAASGGPRRFFGSIP
jgi:hypothetical protein